VREHTRDGDIVAESHVSFDLRDIAAMMRALDGAPGFERTTDDFWDADVVAWRWRTAIPAPSVEMPEELGVQWFLCAEDCEARPIEARLELNRDDHSIWLFAPSPPRLERAEQLFVSTFSSLLGDAIGRDTERPSITWRWQRERWERALARRAPELRRARAVRAA
jgi:hypothetical protein